MNVCIACSPGGHLTEALQLLPILKKHKAFFYTIDVAHVKDSLKGRTKYLVDNPTRNPLKFVSVLIKSLVALIKEQPKVIISFGAGVTVPISLLGKILFGSKLIYIECSAQVREPSLTGKILYNFADLFFVQWKYLKAKYGEKAIYGGLII